jgi:UDP-2-acetamido-2-deoxy-ribo-hexuluronate aminotransferase
MDSIQAAVLLAKLPIFAEEVEARERIGKRYSVLIEEAFAGVEPERRVIVPHIEPHNRSVFAQYTIEVPDRNRVQAGMAERGIPTAVHYPVPLHLQPAFGFLREPVGGFPVAEVVAARVMSLPMHPYLSEANQTEIATALRELVLA